MKLRLGFVAILSLSAVSTFSGLPPLPSNPPYTVYYHSNSHCSGGNYQYTCSYSCGQMHVGGTEVDTVEFMPLPSVMLHVCLATNNAEAQCCDYTTKCGEWYQAPISTCPIPNGSVGLSDQGPGYQYTCQNGPFGD